MVKKKKMPGAHGALKLPPEPFSYLMIDAECSLHMCLPSERALLRGGLPLRRNAHGVADRMGREEVRVFCTTTIVNVRTDIWLTKLHPPPPTTAPYKLLILLD